MPPLLPLPPGRALGALSSIRVMPPMAGIACGKGTFDGLLDQVLSLARVRMLLLLPFFMASSG
ncbi:hypothetical protein ACFSUI_04425 [Ralstonia solanacearum]